MRVLALVIAFAVASACGTAATTASPAPSASTSVSPSPSASAPPTGHVSPYPATRIVVSDVPINGSAGPLILFQLPGDDRLRGMTWDGTRNGVLGGRTTAPGWFQSPDGSRYAIGGMVYTGDGSVVGAVPWDFRPGTFGWAPRGDLLCEALPNAPGTTGATMRLEVGVPGGRPRTVASGFTVYGDNAGYPILACDPESDRAIVGVFGQGLFAGRLYVFKLSTGELLREADAPQGVIGAWATASSDGTLIAYSTQATANSGSTTAVSRAEDGTVIATLAGFEAHGFSGDATLLYGVNTNARSYEVREWRAGRTVWTAAAGYPYGGFLAEPRGSRLAVAIAPANAPGDADVYIVSASDVLGLLDHRVKTSFRY